MPTERVVLTARPPTPEDWLAAADGTAIVEVLPGAALQLVDGAVVVATVLAPREVLAAGEQRRLLAVDEPGRPWWSDVAAADLRAVAPVLERLAAACDGVVV